MSEQALFNVVLHEPEIPNNTGNIGRTCIATGCGLHLIHPLGFSTSEKECRRAGLDYWPRLNPTEHAHWDAFVSWEHERHVTRPARGLESRLWVFSTKGHRPVWDAHLARGDVLLFGKETSGLPDAVLHRYPDRLVTLPMRPRERSLNLATAVCAAIYEGIRQLSERGAISIDAHGRLVL
ncbi:MAG: tRNA (cytidine(34)-2'-O)-methyltransferase [Phycisphaerales bacterium]